MEALDTMSAGQEISEPATTFDVGPDTIAADWPTLEELSRRYVRRVLSNTRGNRTKAGLVLGVDRRTVGRISASEAAWQGPDGRRT